MSGVSSQYFVAYGIGFASNYYAWMLPSFVFYTLLGGGKQQLEQIAACIAGRVSAMIVAKRGDFSIGTTTLG